MRLLWSCLAFLVTDRVRQHRSVVAAVVNPLRSSANVVLCRHFAIIDTVCHREPVSGYFLLGDRNVSSPEKAASARSASVMSSGER